MSYYRRSDDLAYGDDSLPPERWDRDRFERIRARSRGAPPSRERESFRFDERDSFAGGRDKLDISFSERDYERPRPRYEDRYRHEEDYAPPRRPRPEFLERDRVETSGRELAPFRPSREREYEPPTRRGLRPGYARRQSSWDAHDRRPLPRYEERDRDDREVDVTVRVRSPSRGPPPRREAYRPEPEAPHGDEEDYRDFRIRREREREIFRRSASRPARSHSSASESFEEIEVEAPKPPEVKRKKGKTRMPKRLVHMKAINELGLPYVEEEDFFIVQVALQKDEIDDVIKKSETFKASFSTYEYEQPKQLEAPPPPAPEPAASAPKSESSHEHGAAEEEVVETVTTKVIENPTPSEYERYAHAGEDAGSEHSDHKSRVSHHTHKSRHGSPAASHVSHRSRGRSHSERRETREVDFEERTEESGVGGPLTLVYPDRSRRGERDIKAEIRALEAEKRALKYEREAEDKHRKAEFIRENDYEDRDFVRVEKDRRGKLELVRPHREKSRRRSKSRYRDPKTVDAAIRTLT